MLWTVLLEKTLERYLNFKEIKPVNPKGNQSWIFIGRTDDEAETPILWLPDAKNQLIGKDPDAGKDWRKEEKGMTEDKKVGWHHWLNGQEFEQTLGDGKEQGSLVCCSPWGQKESGMTEWLNWTKLSLSFSSESSWPRNQTGVSCIAGSFFTNWAMDGKNQHNIVKQLYFN